MKHYSKIMCASMSVKTSVTVAFTGRLVVIGSLRRRMRWSSMQVEAAERVVRAELLELLMYCKIDPENRIKIFKFSFIF